jgi:hypothetical protein
MFTRRRLKEVEFFLIWTAVFFMATRTISAQSTPVQLYVDARTHQVFTEWAPHRVPLSLPGVISRDELNREVDEQVRQKIQSMEVELNKQQAVNASLAAQNANLSKDVAQMKPDWKSYAQGFGKNLYIGTVFYADYGFYTHTGFGPSWVDNSNFPGQGNNNYNSFDITRTYINILYTPTKDLLFRITPDINRTIGGTNDRFGESGGIGSTVDGNLGIILKYGYVQYKNCFNGDDHFKGATVKFGQLPNAFIPWEEDLNGYRFVYRPNWNYVGLSSAQAGLAFTVPYSIGERTYIDDEFGVYDDATYKQLPQSDIPQVMTRVSVYPFGARWRFDGLGITGFYNYGYGNTLPDLSSVPTALKGPNSYVERVAAILHYTTPDWQLAGEFDWGHNAFSTSALWSGSGPGDAFGFPTCLPAQTAPNTCTNPKTPPGLGTPGFADITTLAQALLNNGRSVQQGFGFFGRYHIPTTPLTVFGLFQLFEPNLNVQKDPFDFERWIVGVSYQYNEYLRLAIDSDNLDFYHSQFNFPTVYAKSFNSAAVFTPLSKTFIQDVVPRDIHSIFLHVEFTY